MNQGPWLDKYRCNLHLSSSSSSFCLAQRDRVPSGVSLYGPCTRPSATPPALPPELSSPSQPPPASDDYVPNEIQCRLRGRSQKEKVWPLGSGPSASPAQVSQEISQSLTINIWTLFVVFPNILLGSNTLALKSLRSSSNTLSFILFTNKLQTPVKRHKTQLIKTDGPH